jgi:hypothetical protein
MRRTAAWTAAVLLGGCAVAGKPITTSVAGTSPAPAPDVYACVRDQIKAIGWTQTSYDTEDQRVSARKYDETQRRPDTQFRRIVNRMFVDVGPGTGGAMSSMKVEVATYAEYTTQRGPTEVQEPTADDAKQAAQTIINRCSQPPAAPAATQQ